MTMSSVSVTALSHTSWMAMGAVPAQQPAMERNLEREMEFGMEPPVNPPIMRLSISRQVVLIVSGRSLSVTT